MDSMAFDRRSFLQRAGAAASVAGCQALVGDQPAAAQQYNEMLNDILANLFHIYGSGKAVTLQVLDKEVWFTDGHVDRKTFEKYERVLKAFGPELKVKERTPIWRFDGQFIRVDYPRKARRTIYTPSPVHGHFLSADYSTVPPRVILTPEVTEGSRWEVTAVANPRTVFTNPRVGEKYVRNLNGRDQDAWLAYSEPKYIREHWTLSEPTLSFDEKMRFDVRHYIADEYSEK